MTKSNRWMAWCDVLVIGLIFFGGCGESEEARAQREQIDKRNQRIMAQQSLEALQEAERQQEQGEASVPE